MAFSDFKTIPDVQKKFGIRHVENDFIKIEEDVSPSEQFLQELEFSRRYIDVFASEGARVKPLSTLFCGKCIRVRCSLRTMDKGSLLPTMKC